MKHARLAKGREEENKAVSVKGVNWYFQKFLTKDQRDRFESISPLIRINSEFVLDLNSPIKGANRRGTEDFDLYDANMSFRDRSYLIKEAGPQQLMQQLKDAGFDIVADALAEDFDF